MSARSSAFRPQSARSSAFRPRSATQLGPRNNRSPTPDNELVKALLCKFIDEPLQKCTQFINEYKRTHSKYPPADHTVLKLSTLDDENEFIYTDTENLDELQRMCLMFNVGLVIVESFDYNFTSTNFTVDVSAADVIPDISHDERVELLNYALILRQDDDSSDSE
jgi:hypothetical protein